MSTPFDPFQRHHSEATAASQPSATITSASPASDTGRTAPWRDYAYDLLTSGEQAKFRAELDQSMREMFMIGFCGRNVQWRKDAALLAGIRELAAHTTIVDEKAVAATLAAAAEQLEHADDGHTDIVCGLDDCEHCHPELVVDEETQGARDLASSERAQARRRADIERVRRIKGRAQA
jgi:hypothetical protein